MRLYHNAQFCKKFSYNFQAGQASISLKLAELYRILCVSFPLFVVLYIGLATEPTST